MKHHMSYEAFTDLVEILRPDISIHEMMSRRANNDNDPLNPELIAATGLQFLGGELEQSLNDIMGISWYYSKLSFKVFYNWRQCL
jgi:hypothetical protein